MTVKKYRKKPVVVEAYQWNGEWPLSHPLIGNWDNNPMTPDKVTINTLEGKMKVSKGDYIIKEPFDKERMYYPCKPDIFEQTYEIVDNKD